MGTRESNLQYTEGSVDPPQTGVLPHGLHQFKKPGAERHPGHRQPEGMNDLSCADPVPIVDRADNLFDRLMRKWGYGSHLFGDITEIAG